MASRTQQEKEDAFKRYNDVTVTQDTDSETLIKMYDDVSPQYDETMVNLAKHKKEAAVDELESILKDNKEALILNLGAGTGIIGKYLFDRGYKNLVALEPSQGMVEQAKKKNVYKEFIMEFVGKEPTSIKEGTYDAVICVGTLIKNHITDAAFPEIIRITKKGGCVVFLSGKVRMEKQLEQYERSMEQLVAEGRWSWINRKVVPEYYQGLDGMIYSLQKT